MTGTSTFYLAIALGFSISVVALISILMSNKTNSTQFYISNTEHLDPKMVKVVNLIGGDLLSLIPKKAQKKSITNRELDRIFKSSGNPWEVTKLEFLALRVSYAFIALIIGLVFTLIVQRGFALSAMIIVVLGYLGWSKPLTHYKKVAESKAKDFKKHFPEMLDYLTMVMSDGTYTFANAIELVLPYLPDSSVKEEFSRVTDSVNTGMTTNEALKDLSTRLPSPALEAFINAVNNANSLNTSMEDLMKTRAKKSREDLMNELELIIQGLPTKTMLTVAPATIFSMLVIFMVPVVVALTATL